MHAQCCDRPSLLDIVSLSFHLRRLGVLSRRLEIVEEAECVSKLPRYVRAARDINTADYFVRSPSATCLNSCCRRSSPGRRRRQSQQRDSRLSCRASRSQRTFALTDDSRRGVDPGLFTLVVPRALSIAADEIPEGSLQRQARVCVGTCVFCELCATKSSAMSDQHNWNLEQRSSAGVTVQQASMRRIQIRRRKIGVFRFNSVTSSGFK